MRGDSLMWSPQQGKKRQILRSYMIDNYPLAQRPFTCVACKFEVQEYLTRYDENGNRVDVKFQQIKVLQHNNCVYRDAHPRLQRNLPDEEVDAYDPGSVTWGSAQFSYTPKCTAGCPSSLGVVITGASKGLGFALAREHLAAGDRVVICGRDAKRLSAACANLKSEYPGREIHGIPCDVSNGHDVAALGVFAVERLGTVHRWINNAGQVTRKKLLADVDPKEIAEAVGANVLGSLLCCREAIRIMRTQESSTRPLYHIFNMGFSQWGAKFSKSACTHKSTKMAVTQLNMSLAEELASEGLKHIGVHNLSPGMVLTDLLLKDSTPTARRFFNTLAEEPETIAAVMVPQIRAAKGTNADISYLSPISAAMRVIVGVPQILNGGRFFDKKGKRVRVTGDQYSSNGVRQQF